MKQQPLTSRNWLGKASAGVILGVLLAVGVTGLILRFGFGEVGIFSTKGQFLMWMVSPLWVGVLSLSFLFRSGLVAWVKLGVANLLVWTIILVGHYLQG